METTPSPSPSPGPGVAPLWILGALMAAASQLGDGAAQTLFLKRVGVAQLPYMFAVKAALDLAAATLYLPWAARLGVWSTLRWIAALGTVGMALLWAACLARLPFAFHLSFAFQESLTTLWTIHWGVVLLDSFSAPQAPRAVTQVQTGSRAGAVLGGLIMGVVAQRWGVLSLLGAAAGFFGLGTLAAWVLRRPGAGQGPLHVDPAGTTDDAVPAREVVHGWHVAARSPLLRAIAWATFLMVLCRYGLRFLYSQVFAQTFSEGDLARFYGFYLVGTNLLSILVQALVTPWLLDRFGLAPVNLTYAAMVVAAFTAVSLRLSWTSAAMARFVETEIKAAFKTPVSNLFYGPFSRQHRGAARALVLGLVVPVATVLVSAALTAQWPGSRLAQAGALVSVAYLAATWWQNRRYHQQRDPMEP